MRVLQYCRKLSTARWDAEHTGTVDQCVSGKRKAQCKIKQQPHKQASVKYTYISVWFGVFVLYIGTQWIMLAQSNSAADHARESLRIPLSPREFFNVCVSYTLKGVLLLCLCYGAITLHPHIDQTVLILQRV